MAYKSSLGAAAARVLVPALFGTVYGSAHAFGSVAYLPAMQCSLAAGLGRPGLHPQALVSVAVGQLNYCNSTWPHSCSWPAVVDLCKLVACLR